MASAGFKREQRAVVLAMAAALCTAIAVLGASMIAGPPSASVPFAARIETALRADMFVVAWLAAAIANVARLRFLSERDIAGSSAQAGSGAVRMAGAVLQNTLEQVVLAVVALWSWRLRSIDRER